MMQSIQIYLSAIQEYFLHRPSIKMKKNLCSDYKSALTIFTSLDSSTTMWYLPSTLQHLHLDVFRVLRPFSFLLKNIIDQ